MESLAEQCLASQLEAAEKKKRLEEQLKIDVLNSHGFTSLHEAQAFFKKLHVSVA